MPAITVKRTELLQHLEAVQPGLSPVDYIEQSGCFVFDKGWIITFNEEVSCRVKSPLPDSFQGAIPHGPLLTMLKRMTCEELELEIKDGKLILISSKSREKVKFLMENEVTLPIHKIEKPTQWKRLHPEFGEAVAITHNCVGNDKFGWELTCVHITPEWIEACDNNLQMARYKLKTGLQGRALVKKEAIKHLVSLDMTKVSETDTWVHFKNPSGLIYSCRRYVESYPDISKHMGLQGDDMSLPKGIAETMSKAETFSSEDKDNNHVVVDLRPGKLRVTGTGSAGTYSKVHAVKYSGRSFSFVTYPKLIVEITKRCNEVKIAPDRLKVDGGRWRWICLLMKPEESKQGE